MIPAKQAFALLFLVLTACAPLPPGGPARPTSGGASGQENLSAKIHTELGAGYYARGQYAVALEELHKAFEAEPNYAPAFSILGLVRAELREDREAEAAFRRALELRPGFSEAENNFGFFLCRRGRIDEALGYFEAALKNPLYTTPETALTNAGACSLRKGDLAGAENHFIRALKRAPSLAGALEGMADVDFRQGRFLASRGKLRQLNELGELSAQALWLGVRIERLLNDKNAEASYATQLRRRFPEAMQTQWMIMGQYDQLGGSQ